MRIVLYDYELEPITVIECPHWRRLGKQEGDMIRLAWTPPISTVKFDPASAPTKMMTMNVVDITFERIGRGDVRSWLAFVADPESALRLKAAFLSGQVGTVQETERAAYRRGFERAVEFFAR